MGKRVVSMKFETLHNDMVAAMKARDKERKNVISTFKWLLSKLITI